MAVPFSQLASTFLDNYDTELNNALKAHNGVVAVFGAKGKIKEENGGGPNFRTRILYAGNPNVAWGSQYSQITTLRTEGVTMASVPQRVIRGSIVLNFVDLDRAVRQGEWAIGNLVEDNKMQAMTTYTQQWAEKLLQATPGADDPMTLLPASASAANGILSPQAPSAQTATTAGISRGDNTWWRNQYTNTSIDISAEAGRATLYKSLYQNCVFGSTLEDEPDFGLTSGEVLGDLGAAVDTNRRATYEDVAIANLGIPNIKFYRAALIRESSTRLSDGTTSKIALINTRDLYLKFLRPSGNGGSKESWNQDNGLGSVPVAVMPFANDTDSLNKIALFYATASLVPAQLRTHGLADNVV